MDFGYHDTKVEHEISSPLDFVGKGVCYFFDNISRTDGDLVLRWSESRWHKFSLAML